MDIESKKLEIKLDKEGDWNTILTLKVNLGSDHTTDVNEAVRRAGQFIREEYAQTSMKFGDKKDE